MEHSLCSLELTGAIELVDVDVLGVVMVDVLDVVVVELVVLVVVLLGVVEDQEG